MKCEHTKVYLVPGNIENVADLVKITAEGGKIFCTECQERLPLEDMYLYDEKNVHVLIPEKYVGGEDDFKGEFSGTPIVTETIEERLKRLEEQDNE